jgi:hypothetical protein
LIDILSVCVSDSIVALNMPKKIVPNNVVDVVLKHCISLDLKLYGQDIVYCKHCNSVVPGGFYRFICHLTGMENVEACERVSDEVRKEMLEFHTSLQEVNEKGCVGVGEERDGNEVDVGSSRDSLKRRRLDSQASGVDNKNEKTLREEACRAIARFFYNNAIPFRALWSSEFKTMCDMVSRHGAGFKPPDYDEISKKYLAEEVKLTNESLEEHKAMWKITGCSIMVDGWADKENWSVLNFLVNSPKGTFFLKSVDLSEYDRESSDKLFKMMDNIVEEVGEENVVQVVTFFSPAFKAAGEMLMAKRTRLYWTPCATHSIEVILQDCEDNIPIHAETMKKCQMIDIFILSQPSLKSLLRHFTEGRDVLLDVGITDCDSSYLTLCCLHENKGALIRMFTSKEWKSMDFSMLGKLVEDVVLNKEFWKNVMICYKSIHHLLFALGLVNLINEPAMGFIYEHMEKAKEEIRTSLSEGGVEKER